MSHPLPNVHYGPVNDGKTHKEGQKPAADNTPDDDEELPETPKSVVKLLGFDPKVFSQKVKAGFLRIVKTK